MSWKKFAVLIPVYNVEKTLGSIIERIRELHVKNPPQIVISNDGSTDDTEAVACSYTNHVVSVPPTERTGVGGATKRGYLYILKHLSYKRFVIKLDGDGQHNPSYIQLMLHHLRNGADYVACSRFHPLSPQRGTPFDRIVLNVMFRDILQNITDFPITDARTGFVGLPMGHIRRIAPKLVVSGYGIPMEILLRLWKICGAHADTREIPHPANYRGITGELDMKYHIETPEDRMQRAAAAYGALLQVLDSLGIPKSKLSKNLLAQ